MWRPRVAAAALIAVGVLLAARWLMRTEPAAQRLGPGQAAGVDAAADSRNTRRAPLPRFQTTAPNEGSPGRVVDLAELAGQAAATASPPTEPEQERIEPGQGMTAEELAHPGRYFVAAAERPELLRAEELSDARAFFVRYRAQLNGDLERLPTQGNVRAVEKARDELITIIQRYDAAIERADGLLPRRTPAPR